MATTKYKINQSITPLTEGENYLYFANSSYLGVLDVVCKFTNQNALYTGFVFSSSSITITGLTEVYNGSWLNENYRTIYVEDDVSPFILPNADRPSICFIQKNLINCSLTNPASSISYGQQYTSGVTTEMTSTPSVAILMGGEDITSTAWSGTTSTINVSSVTGNLNINITYSGIPREYTELEYIESTGTQYINTNILDVNLSGFELKWTPIRLNHSYQCQLAATYDNFNIASQAGLTSTFFRYRGAILGGLTTSTTEINTCSVHNGVFIFNDTQVSTTIGSPLGNARTYVYICTASDTAHNSAGKIYGCKLYDLNDELIFDGVPVIRNSDFKLGMYDTVTRTFFGNSGTGEFIQGPTKELPDIYQEVEYLQSSGAQYINTHTALLNTNKFNVKFQITPTSSLQDIFGVEDSANSRFFVRVATTYTNNLCYYTTGSGAKDLSGFVSSNINTLRTTTNKIIVNSTENNLISFDNNPNNIFLFGLNYRGSINNMPSMKLYSFIMYDNNTMTHKYIPCYRKSDNKPGLYDLISNVFSVNQGTGIDFTVGPDIN